MSAYQRKSYCTGRERERESARGETCVQPCGLIATCTWTTCDHQSTERRRRQASRTLGREPNCAGSSPPPPPAAPPLPRRAPARTLSPLAADRRAGRLRSALIIRLAPAKAEQQALWERKKKKKEFILPRRIPFPRCVTNSKCAH